MGILNFYLIELLAESKSGELFYINLMELFSEYFAQWIRDIKFPLITVLIVNLCAVFIGGIFSSKHNSKRNLPSVSVATILSCLDQAVIFLDQQKKIKYINPGFAELSGYKSGELEGRKLEVIFSKTCDSFQNKKLKEIDIKKRKETLLTKEKRKIEVRYSVAPVLEQGEVKGILCTFIKNKNQKTEGGNSVQKNQEVLAEIKEKLSREKQKRKNLQNRLKQKDKKIEQVVSKDQLTGLLNRQGFCQSVKRRLEKIRGRGYRAAVIFIDLDRFKYINDRLGHDMGDLLLKKIGARLDSLFREDDLVARPGGDEFIVFLENLTQKEIKKIVGRIVQQISSTFKIKEHEISVNLSMGVSVFPEHGTVFDELMQNADIAMYNAKNKQEDYKFYSEQIGLTARERFLKNDLKSALEKEEFYLVYQPLFSVQENEVVGMEALLRWEHPELGNISPVEFIPLAEETKLIIPIGEWVLKKACQRCKKWQQEKNSEISVSVNISVNQLLEDNFAQKVADILKNVNLTPGYLVLEVVENISAHNKAEALNSLRKLKEMGVKIALDDFGSGFSSLAYIKNFPIDNLKIDRSFINGISINKKEQEIIANIISMAHNLDLTVIGEGVEQDHELDFLSDNGCDIVQGYFLAEPDHVDNIENQFF